MTSDIFFPIVSKAAYQAVTTMQREAARAKSAVNQAQGGAAGQSGAGGAGGDALADIAFVVRQIFHHMISEAPGRQKNINVGIRVNKDGSVAASGAGDYSLPGF